MNPKKNDTSVSNRLLVNLTDKIKLKRSDTMLIHHTFNIHGKYKKLYKINKFKNQLWHWMKNLN